MLIDKSHRTWAMLSTAILIAAIVVYVREATHSPHGVTGGSLIGLAFGIVGSSCMILAGLLAARKRIPTWQIGSAQFWLRGHIWLGLLSVPLILFHSGFGWGGLLENLLWITFAIVIVSGVYGLILQQLLPRWMTVRVPIETFGEQIPNRCRWLLVESDKLVAELAGRLDVDCTPVRGVAEDLAYLLGKLRNGKEEEDLQKFLGAIYVLPGANGQSEMTMPDKTPAKAGSETTAEPMPAPMSPASPNPTTPSDGTQPAVAPAPTDAKPLSKIEQMRAAAAAKRAQQPVDVPNPAPLADSTAAPATPPESPATVSEPAAKPMSKVEQMRAAAAAKLALKSAVVPSAAPATAPVPSPSAAPVSPASVVEPSEKPLSKIEQMRAAAAAKRVAAGDAVPAPTPTATSVARKTPPEPSTVAKPIPPKSPSPALTSAPSPPNARTDEVRTFYLGEVRPFLDDRSLCLGSLGNEARARGVFSQLRASLPDDLHPALGQLESCCDERRQFELQRRLHRWLHGWLIVHIPATLVLLVLFAAHVVMALRVVPWSLPLAR
ncbi:MAG: hypothetical protein HZA46_13385 [Planctomycetales bacterium]|nr:hypothetical protein [Planctomycetales bacterium]